MIHFERPPPHHTVFFFFLEREDTSHNGSPSLFANPLATFIRRSYVDVH